MEWERRRGPIVASILEKKASKETQVPTTSKTMCFALVILDILIWVLSFQIRVVDVCFVGVVEADVVDESESELSITGRTKGDFLTTQIDIYSPQELQQLQVSHVIEILTNDPIFKFPQFIN